MLIIPVYRLLAENDNSQNELRKSLNELQAEHEDCIRHISVLAEELEMTKQQLMVSVDQREEEYEDFKNKLEEAAT